ncbi:NDR1/HIN1-like protein 13 [Cucurbita moschata]|uniref:NDR1/HIN1-like protein 13 n=1 Tax=Cucurbita moschata TaxID=3662 RepID=A0A6J1G0D4_CUCMO|nr:NDR1/HIN1-like protein 13 [Cucurbita moschata]
MHHPETNPHFHRPLQPDRRPQPPLQDPSLPPQPHPDPYSDPTTPFPPPSSASSAQPTSGKTPRSKKNRQNIYPPPPQSGQGSQSQTLDPPEKAPRLKRHHQIPYPEAATKLPEQNVHQSRPRVQIQDPSDSQEPHPHHRRRDDGDDHNRRNQQNILLMPLPRQTNPLMWFGAVFCAIFWVLVIVGGLVILIVYLIFRPKSPRFDVAAANLNAAYLDMGYLLNADMNLLANFTNPNKKVSVDFSSMILDLYYGNTLIATRFIAPFSASKQGSHLVNVHMTSSQVRLPILESLRLQKQIENNGIKLELRGIFRARSNFGSLLRYSYWLHSYCTLIIGGPPGGVLLRIKCKTKH